MIRLCLKQRKRISFRLRTEYLWYYCSTILNPTHLISVSFEVAHVLATVPNAMPQRQEGADYVS